MPIQVLEIVKKLFQHFENKGLAGCHIEDQISEKKDVVI